MSTARILILDIETSPNIAYVWGAWKQNIRGQAWLKKWEIMSFAAKWLGEDDIIYRENRYGDERDLLECLFKLLDEADFVVAHNGQKFDLPRIAGRGITHGFSPPSPYRILDTLLVARREFGFVSNTLADLCKELGLTLKGGHKKFPGFELWVECLKGNPEAWKEMRDYNILDIVTLEELYLRLRPWFRNHPNVNRPDPEDDTVRCAKCGSHHIKYRGYYWTAAGLCYRRFRCSDCGGWGRLRNSEKDRSQAPGRNAA